MSVDTFQYLDRLAFIRLKILMQALLNKQRATSFLVTHDILWSLERMLLSLSHNQ